eukprot:TRINITY_DN28584_c0_g1_i1.p1 TRINITY_DN28584_c0_g1~~TRINITY_DN28584_c0_g1_i1.p1  ORF type:complete len:821 (+),score=288.13 TRINITY_DN28584_c0_g1_i1:51-2513(+)
MKKKKSKPSSAPKKKQQAGAAKGAGKGNSKGGKAEPAGPNPYDVFQNKRRRNSVLNERVRGEHRNLARSRQASASERTQKLLKEKLGSRRTSRFRDGRLGGDAEPGDSNVQRLVRLRQKEAKRSFNLGKEEDLQHGGRAISSLDDAEIRRSLVGSDDEEFPQDATVDDIVEQGRLRKAEAAKEKEEHERQLGDLDKEFGNIMSELDFRPPKAQRPIERVEPDNYDKLLKELVFDRKATASERTKKPEEIAREKAEELEALERQRLARADGLADAAEGEGEGGEDKEADDDDSQDDGDGGEEVEGDEEEGEEEEPGEEDPEVAAEEDGEDGPESLKDCEDEDDRLGENCIKLMSSQEAAKVNTSVMKNGPGEDGLPFAPECPADRLAVERLLEGRSAKTALKLVQRVRTRTAVALSADNRAKLRVFFTALLDFAMNVLARSDGDLSARGMTVVYALRQPLLEMANAHPEEATQYFSAKLQALGPESAPKAQELACLKLVALLFPVTDFQHPIVSPALLLADHWAAQLAALGAGIEDLVSEGSMLWSTLYELLLPGKKFCSSFFQLGAALLESCAASAAQGRKQCADAATDIAALLAKALRLLAEDSPEVGLVANEELVRPVLRRISGGGGKEAVAEALKLLDTALCPAGSEENSKSSHGFTPLRLFEAGPAQIKMLDPIFHEEGDRPAAKGMELSETKQLERRLNKERRAAARQLSRDASVLQQLQSRKDDVRRRAQGQERKRVRQIMEVERSELKKMASEFDKSMDTSFGSYSKTKERKKANRRMAGNATADNPKGPSTAKESGAGKKAKGGKKAASKGQ